MYDIAVIGGGVIGGAILRELTKYKLETVLLEKESDVCMGASKANSGIVHAGFDAIPGTNKAKFNALGSKMMKKYARNLGVKYVNNGSLVVAFSDEERTVLKNLLLRGKQNGIKGLRIIEKKTLKKLEPNISDKAICALYAKTGAIISPYELTIAQIGNAMDNGAELKLNFEVSKVCKNHNCFQIYSSNGEIINSKFIINASGSECSRISRLCGDDTIKTGYRRGEYLLLDRENAGLVSHTLFFAPTEKGKGILITKTVDGNILVGPTAEDIEVESNITTSAGLDSVMSKAKTMLKDIPLFNIITSFAGVRTFSLEQHDFIIENSNKVKGLINVCGIESPGLTSAPGIAKYVVSNLLPKEYTAIHNPNFIKKRKSDYYFKSLSLKKKNKIIKRDASFGKIVCRCENVSEGEIRDSIRRNPRATNLDAIKRRTRAGMGRCQSGFCQPRVAEILADELGIPLDKVKKSTEGSYILRGKSK